MKETEKESLYNKALERAKQMLNTSVAYDRFTIESIFPELKESEGERIRKMLIEFFSKGAENNSSTNGISDKDILAWLEKQKTSEEALQYLREHHSPSEISDFQAAMNIAVANAYDKGKADAINTMKTEWGEEDERILNSIIEDVMPYGECPDYPYKEREFFDEGNRKVDWLKSLKDKYTWQTCVHA